MRRLAIARAIVRDAPILILDEPTAGLDAASAARVLGAIGRLRRGRCTLLVTHDEQSLRMADRVITIDHGRIAVPEGIPA